MTFPSFYGIDKADTINSSNINTFFPRLKDNLADLFKRYPSFVPIASIKEVIKRPYPPEFFVKEEWKIQKKQKGVKVFKVY